MSNLEINSLDSQSAQRSRLLLVDDDQKYCRLISDYLSRYGYEVTAVHDGQSGLQLSVGHGFDAIILDVMLPGLDGYAVLKKLREQSQIPVLMLTALGDETDRIVGLEIGADDYLPKTFSPRELLARLRAVLRRTKAVEQSNKTEITVGPLAIDLLARRANLGDELLTLTPVEFDLLVVLAQAKGRVQTREHLLNEIRERNYDIFDRTIDVHISALRRKLQDDPKNPRFIRTVRAAGYMLIDQSEHP
ncbi:MAG: two-component system, OmpR family, response regulator RstA [Cyanobacteriota bacterium erpe_2018_sw_21hr_WHONDRS-SW48-000092_B_bin.40]|nr:two-component system, OmpR family, response regulator RstA [Cyanobacteriota bacterium erpe_2018_sw_21hr_WHONDRS-SW48-000092_B_bin.40]